MSTAEEQQTRMERARATGLFRYMLIREAADASLTSRQRGAMVRALADREHVDPFGRLVRVSRWTLDRWSSWSPRGRKSPTFPDCSR
jgi:putative transposase